MVALINQVGGRRAPLPFVAAVAKNTFISITSNDVGLPRDPKTN